MLTSEDRDSSVHEGVECSRITACADCRVNISTAAVVDSVEVWQDLGMILCVTRRGV
jgi:hypothetical protein